MLLQLEILYIILLKLKKKKILILSFYDNWSYWKDKRKIDINIFVI